MQGRNREQQCNIAASAYEIICKHEDKGKALQMFLEDSNIEGEEIIGIPESFTSEEIETLTKNCEPMLDGILRKLIAERLPKKDFYAKLWEKAIIENIFLVEEKEKIFALYYFWKDERTPYFDVSYGLEMSNEEFVEIRKNKEELLKKVNFVLNIDYLQKTQRSSLLLEIIDECEDEKEKAVVLAHGLDVVETKGIEKLLASIQKKE